MSEVECDPNQFLWAIKYRPSKVSDIILPKKSKDLFQSFVDKGNIQNITLIGNAGVGKTTVARALCSELNLQYMFINGSLNGLIDTLRTQIGQFVQTVSFGSGRKIVIIDEVDGASNALQDALRSFSEQYDSNAAFILTANSRHKIIKPLLSRCTPVEFIIPDSERIGLLKEFLIRVQSILDQEGVEYDLAAVGKYVNACFPDMRKALTGLQRFASTGKITSAILANTASDSDLEELWESLKSKKWDAMRTWVGSHKDIDPNILLRSIYDGIKKRVIASSVPQVILDMSDTMFHLQFHPDTEIELVAFFTRMMSSVNFK